MIIDKYTDKTSIESTVQQNSDIYEKLRMQELEAQKKELMRQVDMNLNYIRYFTSGLMREKVVSPGLKFIREYLNVPAKIDDIRNLKSCIEEFKDFFESYNHYILHDSNIRNNCHKGYSDEYIVSTGLSRTKYYWSLILQSINQRYNPIYSELLEIANALTESLYSRMGKFHFKQITRESGDKRKESFRPVIYFDKIFHITRFPYQMQPLIGLAIDASVFNIGKRNKPDVGQSEEKIEIESIVAHELGHYTFWNNGNLQTYQQRRNAISELIAKIVFSDMLVDACKRAEADGVGSQCDDPVAITDAIPFNAEERGAIFFVWNNWSEEVFADIFATLLVGPGYTKKAQDIILRKGLDKDDLYENDREHPMLILRPFITLAVLKVLLEYVPAEFTQELGAVYQTLAKRWFVDFCKSSTRNKHFKPYNANNILKVDPERLRFFVEPIVRAIMHAKVFNVTSEAEFSLLQGLNFWGKNSEDKHVKSDMKRLKDALEKDKIIEGGEKQPGAETSFKYADVFLPFKDYFEQQFNSNEALHDSICAEIFSIDIVRTEVYEVDLFGRKRHVGAGF